MLEKKYVVAVALCAALAASPVQGQYNPKKGGSVPITFVPPPMENATYSVGVYDAKSGKLARRLCEAAGQNTFKVGLNGLITSWDGKDDDGKPLPPGKYAARGYAVGPLKVEGEAILGNDWTAADEQFRPFFIDAIACVPEDEGLVVSAQVPRDTDVVRFSGTDGHLLWRHTLPTGDDVDHPGPPIPSPLSTLVLFGGDVLVGIGRPPDFAINTADGKGGLRRAPSTGLGNDRMRGLAVPGKDGTIWKIQDGALSQVSATGEALRGLVPAEGEPRFEKVAASTTSDKLYTLERLPSARWERVRGLAWVESKEENGKKVSTWQTFFERNIRPADPSLGLEEPLALSHPESAVVELALEENSLAPGKHEHVKLTAACDDLGSYLATADGLRLRQIGQRHHSRAVKLTKDKNSNGLIFFETDGAAWDEFSIKGTKNIVSFDAGEFEIDAAGEKPIAEKAPDPDL